jgi:hypothetical protein
LRNFGRRADTNSALQLALDGSALHPLDQELLYEAANLLEMHGRPREAAAKLNALITLNATHSPALAALASITCFKTELNVSKARELVSRAMAADPSSSPVLCIAGKIAQYGAQQLPEAFIFKSPVYSGGYILAHTNRYKRLYLYELAGVFVRVRTCQYVLVCVTNTYSSISATAFWHYGQGKASNSNR